MRRPLRHAVVLSAGLAGWLFAATSALGQDQADEFWRLWDLAYTQREAGQYEQMERTALQMRRLAEGRLRSDATLLPRALFRQAEAAIGRGRPKEGRQLYTQALTLARKAHGGEHPFVALVLLDSGFAADQQGDSDEAEALYKQALAVGEKALGPEHVDVAQTLHNLGVLYVDQGRYDEAEPFYKRALEARKKILQPTDPDLGWTLHGLGSLYCEQGRYAEAEPHLKQALAIRREAFGNESAEVSEELTNLALVYCGQKRYAEAEGFYKQALAIDRKLFGNEHAYVAMDLLDLAALYRDQRRYSEAVKSCNEALAIRRRLFGNESVDVGACLSDLALIYESQGRLLEAEPLYERALKIYERGLDKDDPDLAGALYELATAQFWTGKYTAAEANLKRAIAIGRQALGDGPEVADVMLVLAHTYRELGRYKEAEAQIDLAQAIFEAGAAQTGTGMARCLACRGNLLYELGRFAEAEPLLNRALELAEQSEDPDPLEIADYLDTLVELYGLQGRFDLAAQYSRRAYEICWRELPTGHPQLLGSAWNQAWIQEHKGQYAKAAELLRYCMVMYDRNFGRNNRVAAEVRYHLGTIYHSMERYDEAEALLREARDILRQYSGAESHPLAAYCQNALARVYLAAGKLDDADAVLEKAIRLGPLGLSSEVRYFSHLLRAQVLWQRNDRAPAVADLREAMRFAEQQRGRASGAEHQRAKYFAGLAEAFDRMVAWQSQLGDLDAALSAMERSRARSLLDQMSVQGIDLLAGIDRDEAARLRRREREAREKLVQLEARLKELRLDPRLSPTQRQQQADNLAALLRGARADYVQAYGEIRSASPAYRLAIGQDQKPVTLDRLRQWVKKHNALLLEYHLGTEGAHVLVVPAGENASLLPIELTEEQAGTLLLEPGPLTLKSLAAALSNEQKTGVIDLLKGASRPEHPAAVNRKLAVLWEVLMPERARQILTGERGRGAKRLIVVPDGPLAMLPFETLVVHPGGHEEKYLLDVGPPVQYAPSSTVLINLAKRGAGKAGREPVLSIGDPAYREPVDRSGRSAFTPAGQFALAAGRLSRLPHSAYETLWIEQAFDEAGIGATRLMREEATEGNLRRLAPGRRIVHLACHGVVDQAHGNLFGALALTPADERDPLNDGFLTLAEIYELNLQGCELTILSSCDTNLGPQQHGEGVWSVARGFLVAGSRRVAASNWLVDDEAAASLVSVFCTYLARAEKDGAPAHYADALHKAKRWARGEKKWSNPYYWSTFVLVGPD